MSTPWQHTLIDRLVNNANSDGGWGYQSVAATCTEPTVMACLAMAAHRIETQRWVRGLALLAKLQRPNGSVPVSSQVSSPCWTTSLAVLAWTMSGFAAGRRYRAQIEKAADWLITTRGRRLPPRRDVFGHDRTLQAWPWVEGTHSWLEPTAYAVLALRASDKADHPRRHDGFRVIWDRMLPGGGWNYGNTRVLANTLRPFPATTGIALTALAGEPKDSRVDASIAYLSGELPRIRSPFTLSWALIGLTSQNVRPAEAASWLAQCAARSVQQQPNPLEDALLLLADIPSCPLTKVTDGDTRGED